MKRKRLNRDGWGFQYYPYYQMRVDHGSFHGLACLIRLTDGEKNYWHMPKAGRLQVTGAGMTWLELIPDGGRRVITVKYFPEVGIDPERTAYPAAIPPPYRPSVWYVDVIAGTGFDEDGVAVYIDQYLDVVFTPEGDVTVEDRDELDQAYQSGELSREQYDSAILESERILSDLCADIPRTAAWCAEIRRAVEERISQGEPILPCREVLELGDVGALPQTPPGG